MADSFEQITGDLSDERMDRVLALLDELAAAERPDEAMPTWERILTDWTYLSADQRAEFKQTARQLMAGTPGARRLEVIEDWPD